jgi:hypothetical protein
VRSAKISNLFGSDSNPNLHKIWIVSCISASRIFSAKLNLASSMQDSNVCISTKVSDLVDFIEAARPALDGIKPDGARTNHSNLSTPNCSLTVGID